MVNVKAIVLVLFVLPAIILASSSCNVRVTQTPTDSSGRYTTYNAVATNKGVSSVSNIVLVPSSTLKSLDGLAQSSNAYTIGSLAAGASVSFTYKARNSVKWTSTCSASPSTQAPSTQAPSTQAPSTQAPTTKPSSSTKAPTTKPSSSTKAPTTQPSSSTKSTTKAPTTAAPTSSSSTTKPSAGGRLCPAGSWWAPAPLTTWQWQLTGSIDTTKNVQMYDIDLFDGATTALIKTLHAQGKAVICYFSTQYEDWRPDASSFTAAVRGNKLDDWQGENYVDIRSTVVRNAMTARMDLAVSKGCDGVEPDNVDGYQASSGFPLTAADQLNFNTFLATQAHARGLSVGLKNDLSQAKTLQPVFDWALNEQCYQYSECSSLNVFVQAGKAVFNTEYSGSGSTVCPYMNNLKFSSLIKGLDLDASIKAQCCTYLSGGCASPAANAGYTCKSGGKRRRSVEAVEDNDITTQEFTASASTTYTSLFVVALVVLATLF